MALRVYGIRHHGPGSARTLLAALEAWRPDCVLIEGPADIVEPLSFVARDDLVPPVALLAYDVEHPQRASFYPFAAFSPEWVALRWAASCLVPARFMDLPVTHAFGLRAALAAQLPEAPTEADEPEVPENTGESGDPLDTLARAAGYEDGERWWNDLFEQRHVPGAEIATTAEETFAAVLEAMQAMRAHHPAVRDPSEPVREAWMRKVIRAAQKEGFERIAVVCGAWHAPVLVDMPPAREDGEKLKNLPKAKIDTTWIPWTYARLGAASGYGAGVESPGWYDHLWNTREEQAIAPRWLAHVARLLRAADLEAPPASVVEALRLSEALASVRERPRPGLAELNDAARTVFCFGSDRPLEQVHAKLVVGERLGSVPADVPAVPLARDVRAWQKRLRLPPNAEEKVVDLDQRKESDLDKSRFLHRLSLLGIAWGTRGEVSGSKGTFHEIWTLRWLPEFELSIVEAAPLGNTVLDAALTRARTRAREAKTLEELSALLDAVLLADLGAAVDDVLGALQAKSASSADVVDLMLALPALVRVARYGDVRNTDAGAVRRVIDDLVTRIEAGLLLAATSVDDDAATALSDAIQATQGALGTLQDPAHLEAWATVVGRLADRDDLHGLLGGKCARLLRESDRTTPADTERRLSVALSAGQPIARAAAWIEGFLSDAGAVLVHDDALWALVDGWIGAVPPDRFLEVLPVLRRTFATFEAGVKRRLGERAKSASGGETPRAARGADDLDPAIGALAVDTVLALFGAEVRP